MFIGGYLRRSFISVEVARKEKQQVLGKCAVFFGTVIQREDEAEIYTNLFAKFTLKMHQRGIYHHVVFSGLKYEITE